MTITLNLQFERDTKNTYVFVAPKGSPIETLYVRKDGLPQFTPPGAIVVTVTS